MKFYLKKGTDAYGGMGRGKEKKPQPDNALKMALKFRDNNSLVETHVNCKIDV